MKPFLYMLLGAALVAAGAGAQNVLVPTRAPGDSSNAAASTAFVQSAIAPFANSITGLTGDVSATGPGNVASTIQPGVVTSAKMATGAAAANVGTLGGVLGGTLPNPTMAAGAAATNIGSLGGSLTGTLPNPSIAASAVLNSMLANMASGTHKCNPPGGSAAAPLDCSFPTVNVVDFAATGNGSTDDTNAILNAIAACPNGGCEVVFPIPSSCYKTTSSINIGNGNSTPTASTKQGIVLKGMGNPLELAGLTGFNSSAGARLCWGGTSGNIISVNGPINGWGVQNLEIDCQSTASTVGIVAHAAIYGDTRNVDLLNCAVGVSTNSYVGRGSLHNHWNNVFISVPAIANAIGVFQDGDETGTTSNTSYDRWDNLAIFLPGTLTTFGIDLKAVDSIQFFGTHLAGGSASSVGVQFDYTATGAAGQWPAAVTFYGLDDAVGGTQVANVGTPTSPATPNYIIGLLEDNGATVPALANLAVFSSKKVVISGLTGAMSLSTNSAAVGLGIDGPAPTSCVATSGAGTGPSCSFSGGSNNAIGSMIMTTGTAPSSSGNLTLNAPSSFASASGIACAFYLDDNGSAAWGNTANVHSAGLSTASVVASWFNSVAGVLTNLAASTAYRVGYHCFGK